jgi:4-hydroxybenzoate polyprenyltransferase
VLRALLKTMRPRQWIKNIVVFAPLVFDVKLTQPRYLIPTVAGFILLCLISGAVYLINDVADIENDRRHPEKKRRPLASGELSVRLAVTVAVLTIVLALPAGFVLNPLFGVLLSAYFLIHLVYSFWLKHIAIIDVMLIAAGFLLRVAAGVPLVEAERFSPWLYICMMLLALLIGFGKRRHELVLLEDNANMHRKSLGDYNLAFLDQVIGIVTASTIVSYAFYTFSAPNLPANHTMMLSIPFVLYGIFRYLFLVHVKGLGGAPEEIALSDRPLQIAVLLWGLCVVLVLYLR